MKKKISRKTNKKNQLDALEKKSVNQKKKIKQQTI